MKIKHFSLYLLMVLFFMTLPACETLPKKADANAMRIWIAPAYRANTPVTQSGHLYVNVDGHSGADSKRTAKTASNQRY